MSKHELIEDAKRIAALINQELEPRRRIYNSPIPVANAQVWRLHQPAIITNGMMLLCFCNFGLSAYSKYLVARKNDRRLQNFIDRNLICSLRNWREGRWWTTITSSITHADYIHLSVNMTTLYSIGPLAIMLFGTPISAFVWVLGAAACGVATLWWEKHQQQQRRSEGYRLGSETEQQSVGASGSLCALTSALACLMPHLPVVTMGLPVRMPMWMAEISFAAFSAFCMRMGTLPRWGHAGHLGGMAVGLGSYLAFIRLPLRWGRRVLV